MEDHAGGVFLHFRAGKMTYSNGVVTPDLRRGDLSFVQVGNTVDLVWTSHDTTIKIYLPKGKTKVSFVEKCKTGRVLLFEVSEKETSLHFFWLQDKSTVEDAQHLTTLQNALKASEPAVKMADFVEILNRIPVKKEAAKDISLKSVVFSSKGTASIEENYEFYNSKLSKFLPEDKNSTLKQQINNTQVRAAVKALQSTLTDPSGFNEICRSANLPESRKKGVQAFLDLIIAQAKGN